MNNPIPNCHFSLSLPAEEALADFIRQTAMCAAQRGDDSTLVSMRQITILLRLNRTTNPFVQKCIQTLSTASLLCNSLTASQRSLLAITTKNETYDLNVRHALEVMMDNTISYILETYPTDSKTLTRNTFNAIFMFFDNLLNLVYVIYGLGTYDRVKEDNICYRDAEFYRNLYQEAYETYEKQED